MRELLPTPTAADLTTDDLADRYAYPGADAWLRANFVASADGAATFGGLSGPISPEADRRLFMLLRALCDVVLAGASTVRMEGYGPARPKDEYAALRKAAGKPPAPTVAVVTASLDLDLESPLFTEHQTDDRLARPVLLVPAGAPAERLSDARKVADVVVCGQKRVDPGSIPALLAERGLPHILCEGGPRLTAELAAANKVDELCLTISPVVTAGAGTRIMNGPPLPNPSRFDLAVLLEEDGALFTRYVRRHTDDGAA